MEQNGYLDIIKDQTQQALWEVQSEAAPASNRHLFCFLKECGMRGAAYLKIKRGLLC